ncbi:MAG: Uma2 family endonuclease [Spirochaetaceae bacterium]|jgi:Uma2 family endonuclease|nr:Uma2 family endonuclease [Spirochaetaceae bacterium]
MSDALQKPVPEEKQYTYADYRQWELKEGERYELVEGTAYAMSSPNTAHQTISGELFRQIANFLHGKPCKVLAAPYDVRLFYQEDEQDDTVVQPDIAVICDEKKLGPEGCRGAPDMVIEIISPSNTGGEYMRKFNLYLESGVREYWMVSPEDRFVQVNLFKDGKYLSEIHKADTALPVSLFEGLSINLNDVFA